MMIPRLHLFMPAVNAAEHMSALNAAEHMLSAK